MSESEKKGSAWPWVAVPVAAVSLFFVLRECQHRLPPAPHVPSPSVTAPAAPQSPPPDRKPEDSNTAPAPAPAPQ